MSKFIPEDENTTELTTTEAFSVCLVQWIHKAHVKSLLHKYLAWIIRHYQTIKKALLTWIVL